MSQWELNVYVLYIGRGGRELSFLSGGCLPLTLVPLMKMFVLTVVLVATVYFLSGVHVPGEVAGSHRKGCVSEVHGDL